MAGRRRRHLEVGPSRAGLCPVGAPVCGLPRNILSVISSCFARSLLIFHWDTRAACRARASKQGSFRQLWRQLLVSPTLAITGSVVLKMGKKKNRQQRRKPEQSPPTCMPLPCQAGLWLWGLLSSTGIGGKRYKFNIVAVEGLPGWPESPLGWEIARRDPVHPGARAELAGGLRWVSLPSEELFGNDWLGFFGGITFA